jgi:hypothetical protein
VLKPDYARIFWYLAGGPWGLVGTGHISDGERRDLLAAVLDEFLTANIKPQVTVFGAWVPDPGRRQQIVEQFADVFRPFGSRCFLVDGVNEPGAIFFYSDEQSRYAETREVARMLANSGLAVPHISPASPDLLHGAPEGVTDAQVAADTERLMGGLPPQVNAITPHWGRRPWMPHRPLGPAAVGKAIVNDEPRGFRSSVSQIDDPRDFAQDYLDTVNAGEIGYTFHTEPGVWEGYSDSRPNPLFEQNNLFPRIQDIPRIDEIVAALHRVRESGEVIDGGGDTLLAGQALLPEQTIVSPGGHARLHYQSDGNLVIYLDGSPVWASNTSGESAGRLVMQTDGNLVLYDGDREAIRATRTHGHPGAMVQLQDDGNLVLYEDPNGPRAGTPLWASASNEFFD